MNKQFAGYFRTNYDEENWKLIASYLDSDNFDKIPPLTRAGLLNDAFILARAGRLKYSVALELTKYLHRETDYIPLKSLFNEFTNFNQLFRGLEGFELFEVSKACFLPSNCLFCNLMFLELRTITAKLMLFFRQNSAKAWRQQ